MECLPVNKGQSLKLLGASQRDRDSPPVNTPLTRLEVLPRVGGADYVYSLSTGGSLWLQRDNSSWRFMGTAEHAGVS